MFWRAYHCGMTDHRGELAAYLQALSGDDFVYLGGRIDDQDHGHEIAAEVAAEQGTATLNYAFIHRQSVERGFHADGSYRAPVALHWGGEHDVIVEHLALLPQPWEVWDFGDGRAFEIAHPGAGVIELPDPDAPVAEIRTAASRLQDALASMADEMDDAGAIDVDVVDQWVIAVLGKGTDKARAAVLDLATARLPEPDIIDALAGTWPHVYRAYGDSAPVRQFLDALRETEDERFDEHLSSAEKERKWSFRWDAAEVLAEHRPPNALARLKKLAAAKDDRYGRAANPPAVRGYVAVLADEEGISLTDAAERVAGDESFPDGARKAAVDELILSCHTNPEPLRAAKGAIAYLNAGRGDANLRSRVFMRGSDPRTFQSAEHHGSNDSAAEIRELINALLAFADGGTVEVPPQRIEELRRQLDATGA